MLICVHRSSAGGGTLHTVTFPTGTSTWTAPSGVTQLASLAGYGANGTSDGASSVPISLTVMIGYNSSQTGGAAGLSTSDVINAGNAMYAAFSVGSFGPSSTTTWTEFIVGGDSNYRTISNGGNYSSMYITSKGSPSNSIPAGVTLTAANAGSYAGLSNNAAVYAAAQGGAGAASTAFGKSFSGGAYTGTYPNGVGSAALVTTYSSVSVTPGTNYTIVNNSAKPLTLSYYA